jgi:2-octaprenylphenol hydroxylase
MKRDFDVIVVGGGMVGAGFAALLAAYGPTGGLKVAMLEPRPAAHPSEGEPFDLRVSALSRASQRLLQRTSAWPRVLRRGAAPYQRMVVWDEQGTPGGRDSICFDAAQLGEPDLGHIVENRSVQAALAERATACGVSLLRAGVAELVPGREAMTVVTTEGRRLTAAIPGDRPAGAAATG